MGSPDLRERGAGAGLEREPPRHNPGERSSGDKGRSNRAGLLQRPAPRFPGSLRDVHQRTVNKGHSILAGQLRPRALVAVLLAAARIELTKGRTSSGCRSPDRDRLPTPRLRECRNQQHRLRDDPECLCEALLDQRGLRAGGVRGRGSSQCQPTVLTRRLTLSTKI